MTIAEGLRKERNKLNMSQKEFAEKLGINARTYASYERGERDISTSILLSICQTLGISSDELLGNSYADTNIDKPLASSDDAIKEKNAPIISDRSDNIDSVPATEPSLTTQPEYRGFAVLNHDNIYMIPIYRTVSAGYGAFADEYIIGYEPVYLSSQKEAEETFAVVVKGDSMLPRIDEDDIAIVHKQDCFENGDIVVAIQCGNGDGFIKRAFLRRDKLSLESFNPNYPVMTFTGPEIETIKIVGVVKKIIKSV